MKKVPVFLINGFLESGKTTFIESIIRTDEFYKKGNTLIFTCEEGIIDYDKFTLYDRFYTNIIYIEDKTIYTKEKIQQIANSYDADRVIVEGNAMWDSPLELPDNFEVYQEITLIDTTTFENYFANIRQKFVETIRNANAIIFNRIDNKLEKLSSYKRSLQLINAEADYMFQNTKNEIMDTLDDELPYDLNEKTISIQDEHFGIWFIDSYEQKNRYIDKIVNFNGIVYNNKSLKANEIIVGRMAMTCCENDITLLGCIARGKDKIKLSDKSWVNITAKIKYEYFEDEDREEPVLEIIDLKQIKEIKNPIINL